jgi:hypothetical protein
MNRIPLAIGKRMKAIQVRIPGTPPGIPSGLNKFMKKKHSIRAPMTIRMIPPAILVQAT